MLYASLTFSVPITETGAGCSKLNRAKRTSFCPWKKKKNKNTKVPASCARASCRRHYTFLHPLITTTCSYPLLSNWAIPRGSEMTVMSGFSIEIITAVFRKAPCSLIMRFVAELVDFYLGVNGSRGAGDKGWSLVNKLSLLWHNRLTLGVLSGSLFNLQPLLIVEQSGKRHSSDQERIEIISLKRATNEAKQDFFN